MDSVLEKLDMDNTEGRMTMGKDAFEGGITDKLQESVGKNGIVSVLITL